MARPDRDMMLMLTPENTSASWQKTGSVSSRGLRRYRRSAPARPRQVTARQAAASKARPQAVPARRCAPTNALDADGARSMPAPA